MRAYGKWAGNPKGHAEDPTLCVVEVGGRERWHDFRQCSRRRGHGPDGSLCRQHAKQAEVGIPLFIPPDEAGQNGGAP